MLAVAGILIGASASLILRQVGDLGTAELRWLLALGAGNLLSAHRPVALWLPRELAPLGLSTTPLYWLSCLTGRYRAASLGRRPLSLLGLLARGC